MKLGEELCVFNLVTAGDTEQPRPRLIASGERSVSLYTMRRPSRISLSECSLVLVVDRQLTCS